MPNEAILSNEHTRNVESYRRKHSTDVDLQADLDKGKGLLHLETTKSSPLQISLPKDQPHAPTEVYKNCRDRIHELRPRLILVSVDLDDPRVAHLGPPPKLQHLFAPKEFIG
ncbi:unnamed protein product [Prunus brigantina]